MDLEALRKVVFEGIMKGASRMFFADPRDFVFWSEEMEGRILSSICEGCLRAVRDASAFRIMDLRDSDFNEYHLVLPDLLMWSGYDYGKKWWVSLEYKEECGCGRRTSDLYVVYEVRFLDIDKEFCRFLERNGAVLTGFIWWFGVGEDPERLKELYAEFQLLKGSGLWNLNKDSKK